MTGSEQINLTCQGKPVVGSVLGNVNVLFSVQMQAFVMLPHYSLTRMFSLQTVSQRDAWVFSIFVGGHSPEAACHIIWKAGKCNWVTKMKTF